MANTIRSLPAAQAWFEVLPSAARTVAPDSQEFEVQQQRGYEYSGLHLITDVTILTATQTLTITVSGVDRVSGQTYPLLASTAVAAATGSGTPQVLKIEPGITFAANLAVSLHLPPVFRVSVAVNNGLTATYSIGGMLV
jgi:hypothetical protein